MVASLFLHMCSGDSPEEHYELDCDRMSTSARKYNCSGPAPVHGDSLNKIVVRVKACSEIVNISITEEVETNWTNTTIYMTVWLYYKLCILLYLLSISSLDSSTHILQ